MDVFFPELIEIGDNSIIGFNSTILCHEFLVDEYRLGRVRIGKNVTIGANTTILPGVVIADCSMVLLIRLSIAMYPDSWAVCLRARWNEDQ